MEFFVVCPICGTMVWGANPGDIVNNLRIHFSDECEMIDEDERRAV